MPALKWLPEAVEDLERLHRFLADRSGAAAQRAAAAILEGADHLIQHPELGRPLTGGRREQVIRFGVGSYVLRYRVEDEGSVVVVRVWHSREDRG